MNEVKDNYELPHHFSIAGKNSAKKYPVLSSKINKRNLLQHRNALVKDLFIPDNDTIKDNNESTDENHTQINPYNNNNEVQSTVMKYKHINNTQHKRTKSISPKQIRNTFHEDKLKYHNKHMKDFKRIENKNEKPSCTKYTPNMNYIWAKTNSGPEWKTICGRSNHISFDDRDFYITHQDISKTNKKVYIHMHKQTMRNGFPIDNNVRVRYEKQFTPHSPNEHHLSHRNTLNVSNPLISPNKTFKSNLSHKNISPSTTLSLISPRYNCNIHSVPDFNKTISRDKLTKLEQRNALDVPYHSPNVNIVKDRSIMMVMYNKKRFRHHNINNKNNKYKRLINSTPEFPLNYNINNVNNHEHPVVPNFALMTARPEDNGDPLPSFMKGIHSRASSFITTNKTLQMNNYAKSCYLGQYSSFFPKRSFNKNINLALLNSDNIDLNLKDNNNEFYILANYVNKISRAHKKNVVAVLKNNNYYKFDNVTLKHVEHGKKFTSERRLKDFLINLRKAEYM
jgi:hypothetical protein